MSGPYTVYPDPADSPYMIGVPCPYCGVGVDERCRTSGGNVYGELCHKKRKDAAYAVSAKLKTIKPKRVKPPVAREPQEPLDGPAGIKLALWYIKTAGGLVRAQRFLDGAAAALKLTPQD